MNPNDHLSWPVNNITFSFDASFNALFPDPRTKDQIRLALATWGAASTTPYGTVYSYRRNNPAVFGAFADIRTITLHELGHALGFGHPNMGAAQNLNFIPQPDGGGCNNLMVRPNTTQEVMHAFVASGEYNHVLSWDELDAFCVVYGGRALVFTEVPNGGDIVFSTWNGPPNNFAVTSPAGVQGTIATGSTVTSATISFNKVPPIPVGTSTHGINWTVTCNALDAHIVTIRTHGTQNPTPFGYWNNNVQGGYQPNPNYVFGAPSPSATPAGASLKDDLTWRWSNSPSDIPAGTPFHPGLGLDVDDWTVVNCIVFDAALNTSIVPVTAEHDFNDGVFAMASLSRDHPVYGLKGPTRQNGDEPQESASTFLPSGTNSICGSGFEIIATEAPQTTLFNLRYADVTGHGLTLSNLNGGWLNYYQTNGLVTTVTNFGVHNLASNARFVVLLQGGIDCVPVDVVTNGNYLMLNRPDLLNKELFLAWTTTNSENHVENFALHGEPIIATPPKLTIWPQGGYPTNSAVLTWPAPSYGYVLQQNTDLLTTNWVNVTLVPTVSNGTNQVIISPARGDVFYRLKGQF